MPESSPEEAAHAHARATVAVDLAAAFGDMTPEALAKAMQVGNTSWTLTGYALAAQGRDGDDYVFDVTYESDLGTLPLRYRFRQIDGDWKVVDVERRP